MRTRGLRFISQGLASKKKKKSQMNGGRNSSRRVPCLTRQFGRFGSLSRKGLSRKRGSSVESPSTRWRRRKQFSALVVRGFP